MKLKDYMAEHNLTCKAVGTAIEIKGESVRRHANGERIPRPEIMERYRVYTNDAVTPNDFYQAPN